MTIESTAELVSDEGAVDAPELTADEQAQQASERLLQRLATLESNQFILRQELNGAKGVADRAHSLITDLSTSLTEQYAPKRALQVLEKTVRASLGDEAWEAYQRDEEMADLRAIAMKKPVPTEPAAVPDEAQVFRMVLDAEFGNSVIPDLKKYAKSIGYPYDIVEASKPGGRLKMPTMRGIESPDDPHGWGGYKAEAQAFIKADNDAIKAANKQRVPLAENGPRGGAPGAVNWEAALELAKKGQLSDKQLADMLASEKP